MCVLLGRQQKRNLLLKLRDSAKGLVCLLLIINLVFVSFLGFFLSSKVTMLGSKQENVEKVEPLPDPEPGFLFYDLPLPQWVQGFIMPILGGEVPNNPNLLPNAPRNYRNGRHEGVDIYCDYGTPVLAAKDGHVILIRTNHIDTSPTYRNRLLEISHKLFQTPPEILTLLHGRQVVLDHGLTNGRWVVTVYSHLSDIPADLKIGDFVRQGTIIGNVGNSGTSKAGSHKGAHLHFEIRVDGHYLGQGMSPRQAGLLFKNILERS